MPTATLVAKTIRRQIWEELNLTASAGVAPNKFLAKIASDWKKPNGQFVIQPNEVQAFLLPLPVGRIPGVGKVTENRMAQVGIKTVGDIYAMEMVTLEEHFGRYGSASTNWREGSTITLSFQIACASRFPQKTRSRTIFLWSNAKFISDAWPKRYGLLRRTTLRAKTVGLKLKTKEFSSLTRSQTLATPLSSCDEFATITLTLCRRIDLGPQQLYRLVGVGLSNFQSDIEIVSPLFSGESGPDATIVRSV
ncbi:hypothetical protein BH10ACI4_BH10ACI4_02140 [soil metagenome]